MTETSDYIPPEQLTEQADRVLQYVIARVTEQGFFHGDSSERDHAVQQAFDYGWAPEGTKKITAHFNAAIKAGKPLCSVSVETIVNKALEEIQTHAKEDMRDGWKFVAFSPLFLIPAAVGCLMIAPGVGVAAAGVGAVAAAAAPAAHIGIGTIFTGVAAGVLGLGGVAIGLNAGSAFSDGRDQWSRHKKFAQEAKKILPYPGDKAPAFTA